MPDPRPKPAPYGGLAPKARRKPRPMYTRYRDDNGKQVRPRKRAEDDAINPKTGRPYWDEMAPDTKDPGRKLTSAYVKQRKAAGTKGY